MTLRSLFHHCIGCFRVLLVKILFSTFIRSAIVSKSNQIKIYICMDIRYVIFAKSDVCFSLPVALFSLWILWFLPRFGYQDGVRSNHVQWLRQRSSRNNGDESGLLGNWCLNSLLLLQLVLLCQSIYSSTCAGRLTWIVVFVVLMFAIGVCWSLLIRCLLFSNRQ